MVVKGKISKGLGERNAILLSEGEVQGHVASSNRSGKGTLILLRERIRRREKSEDEEDEEKGGKTFRKIS